MDQILVELGWILYGIVFMVTSVIVILLTGHYIAQFAMFIIYGKEEETRQ